ncbi:MAG TPA: alpha/beta family hydrolase [Candidatus Binatia bacterium]|nr:alpha/beta family hydrolase [Candidatus Binatia bacterium]
MRIQARPIEWTAGRTVSALIGYPERFRAGRTPAVILAHGAGNDMSNPLLSAVHEGLAARGYVSVKFNFPYTERGGRAPDPAPVLEACYRAVLDTVRADSQLAPPGIVIGGKSMGGRMASHLAAQGIDVAGLLFLGYPLHPAGRPEKLRTAHLARIVAPMLFFAGTRDTLCTLDRLRETLRGLPRATLHVIEGGDHSFKLPARLRRSAQSVIDELIDVATAWLYTVLPIDREDCDGR